MGYAKKEGCGLPKLRYRARERVRRGENNNR